MDHGALRFVAERIKGRSSVGLIGKAVDPWTGRGAEDMGGDRGEKTTILAFGVHSVRKGTISLMRMFRDFPEQLERFRLLIVGPVRGDIREEFDTLLAETQNVQSIEKFVPDAECWQYFESADIVACPYVNFHGSSNVTIRAAAAGLPVIAPEFGFLGEVVEESGIGFTYAEQTSASILEALLKVENSLRENPEMLKSACREYASFHRASRYAPSLLEAFDSPTVSI